MQKIFFSLFITTLLASACCKPKTSGELYEAITIERTGCFGKCPVYRAVIMSNGTATYEGTRDVVRKGKHTATLTCKAFNSLLKQAADMKFLELADKYPADGRAIADLPALNISFSDGKSVKKVVGKQGAPPTYYEFGKAIDAVLNAATWKSETEKK
ncbi:MAG: hypothetical protein RI894_2532 [Bacteroidota bacterium]|jgi:hypothetical protein